MIKIIYAMILLTALFNFLTWILRKKVEYDRRSKKKGLRN